MIYIKIKKDVYNTDKLEKIKNDYPLSYSRNKALVKVIKSILNNDLKDYPEIDLIITHKNTHTILGRFCGNYIIKHKEYKFIKGNNPYIVLFWHNIETYYNYKCIKGLRSVLLHEFGHFKQWLNHESLGHKNSLHSLATGNADIDLTRHLEYLNLKTKKHIEDWSCD